MKRPNRIHHLVLLSATMLLAGPARADDSPRAESPVDAKIHEIRITATDGRVAWSEVIDAVAETGRIDISVLDELPEGSINLNDGRALLGLLALNFALPDECSVKAVRGEPGEEPQLLITFDQDAAFERPRDIQRRIRQRAGDDAKDYGLRLDDDWEDVNRERPVVVLIHGYNSNAESLSALHQVLRTENWPCGLFEYPNDGPLNESAAFLSAELADFRKDYPDRSVAVVAHSMGGLVARAVIEDPEFDPGNVRRFIMVATPNQGSQLAYFPAGLDWVEHRQQDDDEAEGLFRRSAADGLNEAALDMWPESRFLRTLNARDRNPHVRYSLLIGTRGPLSEDGVDELREQIRTRIDDYKLLRLVRPRIEEALEDLDEFTVNQGDGAVAVKRARLEGVEDTELLHFTHLALTREAGDPQFDELVEAIQSRLVLDLADSDGSRPPADFSDK